MLFIYAGISFLYFKIMPEFLLELSNTVIGSALMAGCSAACMFGATLWLNLTGLREMDKCIKRQDGRPDLGPLLLPAVVGLGASMASTYLIGVGFSAKFIRDATRYPDDALWFWVLAAIPPIVHLGMVVTDIIRMSLKIEHKRDLKWFEKN